MAGGFRIASAYVHVSAQTDRAQMRRAARQVGQEAADGYTDGFSAGARSGMRRGVSAAHRPLRDARGRFVASGTQQGAAYAGAFSSAAQRGIRVERGRFISAGEDSGEGFGEGFTRGAEGRMRDAHGRFIKGLEDGPDWGGGGRRGGGRFMGGMSDAVSGGLGGITNMFTRSFGMLGKVPWLLVGIVAAAMAALPLIGATAGVAFTLAFGAGIAGIGLFAAAQADRVREAFSGLRDHVVSTMQEIARPLEQTLVDVSDDLTDLFDSLSPHLEQAFADMAPALSRFSADLFGAFEGDGSLIDSITGSFTALLDVIGPELEGAFDRMGTALSELFTTVEENPDVFGGIVIGLLDFITGTIRLVGWLSEAYVWITERIPGGLLTLISPLGGLTTALLDSDEAGGKLTSKMREMGAAFSEAGGFISESMDYARERLLPILDDIQGRLADSDVLDTVSGWWSEISEIVSLGGELIGTILRRATDAATWIWETFGERIIGHFSGLWTILSGMVSGGFEVIKGIFNTAIGILTGDWSRAWDGIKQVFAGIWQALVGIVTGAWQILTNIVGGIVDAVVGAFTWLYDTLVGNSIIPDMVEAIIGWFVSLRDRGAALVAALRDWVVARVRALRDRAVAAALQLRDRVLGFFTGLRDRGVSTLTNLRDRGTAIVGAMRDWVVARARALRDQVSAAFDSFRSRAISSFERARDGIRSVWNKLEEVAKKPVRFVISTVYNEGIRKLWNRIADKVPGVGSIGKVDLPRGFRDGGMVDMRAGGVQPGYSAQDNRVALFRDGEGVLVPEAVQSLGPSFVHAANNLKGRASSLLAGLPGFRFGGIIGDFGDKMSGFFKGGFMDAVNGVTGPILGALRDDYGSTGFQGLPTNIIEHLIGKLHGFWSPFASQLEGGDGQKVVDVARSQVGISGRPNKFTEPFFSAAWCGMFVDWVFKKANAHKALDAVRDGWTPLVSNFTTLPRVSRSEAQPGDLALYRSDAGHINIVADPATGESVGGNESNAVRRQFGYMNSASSIRRPAFAGGGLVEARQFWNQDKRETPDAFTPLRDKVMRRALDVAPTHDTGGVVLDKRAAVNHRGEAELVVLREEMRAWAEATRTGGDVHLHFESGAITIPAADIAQMKSAVAFFDRLQSEARRHGARTRVGAPTR